MQDYTIVPNLKEFSKGFSGDPYSLVVVEAGSYPDSLLFQNLKQSEFTAKYSFYLSRLCLLNELYMLDFFLEELEKDGYTVIFLESTREVLDKHAMFSEPLEIEGFQAPKGGSLYPFQQFTLRKAFYCAQGFSVEGSTAAGRFYFAGLGTGTGKSIISAAGAQELFNRGEIDLVIAFTMRKLKINLCRNFNETTQLRAVVPDGDKKRRRKIYEGGDFEVLVTNYEKCHFDYDEMAKLVKGKRVLWVMDEVQKVLKSSGSGRPTLARKGLSKLVRSCISSVWPMSASVSSGSPLRYHDLFSLHGRTRSNILGTKGDFERTYLKSRFEKAFYTKTGGRFVQTFDTWDKDKLEDVRHRVAPHVQSVRKTDPGIRDSFKGLQTVEHPIQMSDRDRELYDIIGKMAREQAEEGFTVTQHLQLMRYICNTPEALAYSESKLAKEVREAYPSYINSDECSKMEVFLDQVESIAEAGDKVVAFTQYTNMTLFILEKYLRKRKIKFVSHFGAGMSDKQAQEAQDTFKRDDSITLFLSSDAGAYGLNFQEARFVINYEPTYSYDTLMQRGDRINRADSYLDGLTSYVYLTNDSVEENIWKINNARRETTATVQGTVETLNSEYERLGSLKEGTDLFEHFVLFGEGKTSNELQ